MLTLGIDIGSTTSKVVVLDAAGKVVESKITPTGASPASTGEALIAELSGKHSIAKVYSTGYGRSLIACADKRLTEITCHAVGVNCLHPTAIGVIDIGGQDSKAIHLAPDGSVLDFAMNDKCAAGTGSFLDNIARKFDISYPAMLEYYEHSDKRVNINSTCVVFAESEIIGLLANGESMENIFKGVLRAIAMRINRLYSQVKLSASAEIYFTGGVAQNVAMQRALSEELKADITVDPYAQLMGALGAAVLARRDL